MVGILIVEDEPQLATYIQEVFTRAGYDRADIAASAAEALSLVSQHRPDLVLMDIRLRGDMDGIELACELARRYSIRTVFLSGALDSDTLERARAAKPLGFLSKPFLPSHVFSAVEQALSEMMAHERTGNLP